MDCSQKLLVHAGFSNKILVVAMPSLEDLSIQELNPGLLHDDARFFTVDTLNSLWKGSPSDVPPST